MTLKLKDFIVCRRANRIKTPIHFQTPAKRWNDSCKEGTNHAIYFVKPLAQI